ncbi:MAG TPA: EAL domain-containing protein [Acidimicrobiia bacterium]|jgi:diguanylate cyclase (GGDEF)-like protein/PAS domain S-box-containing protein|nr:EAL domain-containing protein [Acidimicrobiia bacterium]
MFLIAVGRRHRRGRFRYVGINDAYAAHIGFHNDVSDIVGRTPEDLLPVDFAAAAVERYEQVADTGEPLHYEVGFDFRDHSLEYDVTLQPILDRSGRSTHVHGIARHFTDRDAALRQTERRFAALVEHSSDMITVLDAEGRILYGSPAVTAVLGWPSGVFSNGDPSRDVSAFDLVHPDDLELVESLFRQGIAEGKREDRREFRLRRADGSWCWVDAVGTNRLDDPAVRGIVVNSRDITERRAAEEALRANQDRFRSLVQHASDFVVVSGPDGLVSYASPATGVFVGQEPAEIVGTEHAALVHPDDRDAFFVTLDEVRGDPGCSRMLSVRLRRVDGEFRWLEMVATNLLEDANVQGVVINARDVTDRVQAEAALRESEERFRSAFEHAPIGMALADRTGRVFRSNESFAQMLGRRPSDVTGLTIRQFTHPDDWDDNDDKIKRLFAGEIRGYRLEKRYVHADGHPIWVSVSVSAVRNHDGEPVYMIGQIEDITERKAIGERLVHQAIHDPLTGLPNRSLFMDRLRAIMVRSNRRRHRIAVLFVDLDRFKVINDSLGHDAGDQLLLAVAHRLRQMVRPTDTVARFGGDEFTILCEDAANPAAVKALAERVLEEIERPVWLADGEVFVTASIGIAFCDRGSGTPETLVRDADTAMYRAKERGRRRVEFFDEESRAQTVEHLNIANALHHALERGEFELHYQPILELETGRVYGYEALVRWRHPERGLIAPIDFIGLAEETGLIVPLGRWVLETACAQAARWQAGPGHGRPLTVSANVSPRQLAEPSFPEQLGQIVGQTRIRPGSLWLEITETALMQDTESAIGTLRALRALDVHLAVDDFGTGYSSLSHLKRFPIEALKIDQGFIRGLARDPEDTAIVTAVVSLAHALGLSCTAEGVETPEQLAELRTLGCELAQGHLFAEPRPAEELTDPGSLEAWRALADR